MKHYIAIKKAYTLVFLSLAGWLFFAYFSINEQIENQRIYGTLINLSGRQRALSQNTALMTVRVFRDKESNLLDHRNELIKTMKREHHFVTANLTSERMKLEYYAPPFNHDKKVHAYFKLLENVPVTDINAYVQKVLKSSFELLPTLNHAVNEFELEFNAKTNALEKRFMLILLGALLTLISESLFIVRPLLKKQQISITKLNRSEQRLSDISKSTHDWIWEIDSEGRFIFVSEGIKKLLGYEPEEVIGKTPFDLMPTEEADRIRPYFAEVVAEKKVFKKLVNVNFHKKGHKVIVETNGIPILDADGALTGFRGTDTDITERITANKLLEQSEQNLKHAQEIALLGSWTMDHTSKKLELSDQIYTIYELDKTSFQPNYQNFLDAVDPDARALIRKAFESSIKKHIPYYIEHPVKMADGRIKFVEARGDTKYDSYGRPVVSTGTVMDITRRKQAEQKCKNFLKLASDAVHILDTQGNVLECSQSFADLLGYSYEETLKLNVTDWECDIPHDQLIQKFQSMFDSPEIHIIETRNKRKDGKIIDVQISNRGIDMDGIKYIYSSSRDITEQKQIIKERLAREVQLNAITNTSQDGIIMMDPQGYIEFWSPATEKILGYTSNEAIGRKLHELFVPARYLPANIATFTEFQKSGRGNAVGKLTELYARHKDGHEISVALSLGAVQMEQQWHAVGVLRDISENKKAEQKTRELKEEFETIFEIVPVPIVYVNAEGTVYRRNTALTNLIGYNEQEIPDFDSWLLKAFPDPVYRQEAHSLWLEHVDEARKSDGHIKPIEIEILCKDYSVRPIIVAGELFRDGFIATLVDMTDQESAKTALMKAKESAESANRAKSNFLATMSHEIRTPLNAIINSAYLLGQTDLDTEQHEDVTTIETASKSLLLLINDTLDFAKIEAEEMALESHTFSLVEMINDLKLLFAPTCREKGIGLQIPGPGSDMLPPFLIGDSNRLHQMLINLLSNAVKFTEKGTVSLMLECIEQQKETGFIKIRFSVIDSGIGVDPDKIESLFSPFTQADMSTTRKYGGTGLGLSIVKRMAALMGGTIDVESTPGIGSIFRLEIPLSIGEDNLDTTMVATSGRPSLNGLNILVVDDGLVNLRVLERVLKSKGAIPTTCSSGKKAIDLLKNNPGTIDLILMDIQMPEMNGRDATSIIRNELHLDMPVIALTGGATRSEKELALTAGMNAFLIKPVSPAKLEQVVNEIIGGSQPKHMEQAGIEEEPSPPLASWTVPEGIDQTEVIRILGDNPVFFKEILKIFTADAAGLDKHLQQLIKNADFSTAARLVHKVRGQLANIGAVDLFKTAGELENALNQDQPEVTNLLPNFSEHCTTLISDVNIWISANDFPKEMGDI